MASEDSDQVLSGFSMIHCLRELSDLDQPLGREMSAALADLHAEGKLLEIVVLRCPKRIRSEERNDHLEEIFPSAHRVAMEMLFVVVAPSIDTDGPDAEEGAQIIQRAHATSTLHHHKAVGHLESGLVALPTCPVWLPNEAD